MGMRIDFYGEDPFDNLINTRGGAKYKAIRNVVQELVDDETEHVNIDIRVKLAAEILLIFAFDFVCSAANDKQANIYSVFKIVSMDDDEIAKIVESLKSSQNEDEYARHIAMGLMYLTETGAEIKKHAKYVAKGTMMTHFYHSFYQHKNSTNEFIKSLGNGNIANKTAVTKTEKRDDSAAIAKKQEAERLAKEKAEKAKEAERIALEEKRKEEARVAEEKRKELEKQKAEEKAREEARIVEAAKENDVTDDFFTGLDDDDIKPNETIKETAPSSTTEDDDDFSFDPTDFMDDDL